MVRPNTQSENPGMFDFARVLRGVSVLALGSDLALCADTAVEIRQDDASILYMSGGVHYLEQL